MKNVTWPCQIPHTRALMTLLPSQVRIFLQNVLEAGALEMFLSKKVVCNMSITIIFTLLVTVVFVDRGADRPQPAVRPAVRGRYSRFQ